MRRAAIIRRGLLISSLLTLACAGCVRSGSGSYTFSQPFGSWRGGMVASDSLGVSMNNADGIRRAAAANPNTTTIVGVSSESAE